MPNQKLPSRDLTGWFFLTFFGTKEKPLINHQGVVRAQFEGLCLVQYFSWFDGSPTTSQLVPLSKMVSHPLAEFCSGAWTFFESEPEMTSWIERHPKYGGDNSDV